MLIGKLKVLFGMFLFATFLAAGAMTWARPDGKNTSPTPTVSVAPQIARPREAPPQSPDSERTVMLTVRNRPR